MLELLMPRMAADSHSWEDFYGREGEWSSGFSYRGKTRAGVTVTEEVALTYEAVFAATRVIAEGVTVPLPCYERVSENERRVVHTPASDAVRHMANPRLPAGVFREGRVAHQVNWGGGFAEIQEDVRRGELTLWPIHPSRVSPADDGKHDYKVTNNKDKPSYLYADQVLHIPGCLSDDGLWGRGVIRVGRETIGLGIGTERSVQSFFGSGGQPKGIVEGPGFGGDDSKAREKRKLWREEWAEVHGNPENNVPSVALFGPGVKYTPMSLTNEANQLIQSRQLNKANVATLYGIPGYKIGADTKETAGTIEQKAIEFVVYSLLPWARKWEEQCNFKLLSISERKTFYFEHNFAALLRGDIVARYNAYRIAFSIGMMCVNEIRRLENLPGIGPRGDIFLVPANMVTLERMMSGDIGNGHGLGSDTTGSPADNPMDRQAQMDRQHHAWLKSLPGIQRDEAKNQLKQLEQDLLPNPVQWREVARSALMDALSRAFTKEANAATRAVKGDFDAWLREFYSEHEAWMTEFVGTACKVLALVGVKKWERPGDLAAWLRARSIEALRSSYNTDTPQVFSRKLADWPTKRAAEVAEEILQS